MSILYISVFEHANAMVFLTVLSPFIIMPGQILFRGKVCLGFVTVYLCG